MKDIISDSLWAHFIMFLFVMSTILPLFSVIPWLAVLIGSGYVLLLFNSAMKIANFEMSKQGELLEIFNKSDADEVSVNIKHIYYK